MKIFVSAGEVSGDLHLSYLVKNILEIDSSVKFYGAAGDLSRAAGVEIVQDIKELAVMGFVEGLKNIVFLRKSKRVFEFYKRK